MALEGLSNVDGPSFNRVVRIATAPGLARAVVEDDFHHFRVGIRHDGEVLVGVTSDSPRHPYSLCPAAGDRLRELVGRPLTRSVIEAMHTVDARQQCTHQLDIAALAIAAAATGVRRQRYDAVVEDGLAAKRRAVLLRDSDVVLAWELEGRTLVAPEMCAGVRIDAGFTRWAVEALPPEEVEAALVLRRAIFVSFGRPYVALLDETAHAEPKAGCWVQQPERAERALRRRGSTEDFTGRRQVLTSADESWLAFNDNTGSSRC